jgi:EAL and modified HD-GYP domain-containing signal transduction protein
MSEFFVGRQPIYGRSGDLVAYELLFREAGGATQADIVDGDIATAQVIIGMFGSRGLGALSGGKRLFINATETMLTSGTLSLLPSEQVVVEVLEDVKATPRILAALEQLRSQGFTVALDDWVDDPEREALLALADIVKVEVLRYPASSLAALVGRLQARGLELLAEKVETAQQHTLCLHLGFSYFQGYHYARAETLQHDHLRSGRLSTLRLITLLQDPDSTSTRLAELIEHDPAISVKLLRLCSSAGIGRRRINVVEDAIRILGIHKIQQLATLIGMTRLSGGGDNARLALTRAKACELLAPRHKASPRAAFLLGLLSTLEDTLGVAFVDHVQELPVDAELGAVLLGNRKSPLGLCLASTLAFEVEPASHEAASMSTHRFSQAYLEAMVWANATADEMGMD